MANTRAVSRSIQSDRKAAPESLSSGGSVTFGPITLFRMVCCVSASLASHTMGLDCGSGSVHNGKVHRALTAIPEAESHVSPNMQAREAQLRLRAAS